MVLYLLAFIYPIEYNFSNSEIHANECKAYRPTVDLESGPNLNPIKLLDYSAAYLASYSNLIR